MDFKGLLLHCGLKQTYWGGGTKYIFFKCYFVQFDGFANLYWYNIYTIYNINNIYNIFVNCNYCIVYCILYHPFIYFTMLQNCTNSISVQIYFTLIIWYLELKLLFLARFTNLCRMVLLVRFCPTCPEELQKTGNMGVKNR